MRCLDWFTPMGCAWQTWALVAVQILLFLYVAVVRGRLQYTNDKRFP